MKKKRLGPLSSRGLSLLTKKVRNEAREKRKRKSFSRPPLSVSFLASIGRCIARILRGIFLDYRSLLSPPKGRRAREERVEGSGRARKKNNRAIFSCLTRLEN